MPKKLPLLALAIGILALSRVLSPAAAAPSPAKPVAPAQAATEPRPAWTEAHRQGPLSAVETRAFMRELTQYVFDHHLKRDAASPQRGMVYEYFNTKRAGQYDQWIQGEALDTMHDGAWFAAALATAYRATGDAYYKDFLTQWVLPFYLKMLNHSDELFAPDNHNAAPDAPAFDREHLLQKGEKGFVPYWWDDGASISLEMAVKKRPLLFYRGHDELARRGEPNPHYKLRGYSHGSSNHLAQDLGVMLQVAWLLLKDSAEPTDKRLTTEIAAAAKNLHQCRMNHHNHIPAVCAAYGLSHGLADELRRIPDGEAAGNWKPANHYVTALRDYKPGQRCALPGFADDQEYAYYSGLARHGTLPRPLAFKVIYDAFTAPLLYRLYSDDAAVPSGINRFDLHPYYFKDGKPEDYRSDRKGPGGQPRPIGSRMGPQNMVATGWALQAMKAWPGLWDGRKKQLAEADVQLGNGALDYFPRDRWLALPFKLPEPVSKGFITLDMRATTHYLNIGVHHTGGWGVPWKYALQLFKRPQCEGPWMNFWITSTNQSVATSDNVLLHGCPSTSVVNGGILDTSYIIPFSAASKLLHGGTLFHWCGDTNATNTWFQLIEHDRFSVRAGELKKNYYFASGETNVVAALERELGHGLRTWSAIFKEKGYIPTGLGAGGMGGGYTWEDMSDAGGCAHLLKAGAQWLLHLEGKRDWETHHLPTVR